MVITENDRHGDNIACSNDFWQVLGLVRAAKQSCFGYAISLFDFFVYGNLNALAPQESFFYIFASTFEKLNLDRGRKYPIAKMDSVVEHISASSASSYLSAILPRGIDSIYLTPELPEEDSDAEKEMAREASKVETQRFRRYLDVTMPNFMIVMAKLVRDYIDYGNCVCLLDRQKGALHLTHIPFKDAYFWSGEDYRVFFFMYEQTLPWHEFKAQYPDSNIARLTEVTLQHIYTNDISIISTLGTQINIFKTQSDTLEVGSVWHLCVHEATRQMMFSDILRHNPVFKARNNTATGFLSGPASVGSINLRSYYSRSNIYGRGAGIQSLSSIIQANLAVQLKNKGAMLTVDPCTVSPAGTCLNKNDLENEDQLVIAPGFNNTYDFLGMSSQPLGAKYFEILNKTAEVISSFTENYEMHLKQIETAYNTEIFSVAAAPNQTATEVVERMSAASRLFRGMAGPFYCELLSPLLEFAIANMPIDPNTASMRKNKVKVFSFEDEQRREIKAAKLEKYMGMLVNLSSAGIAIPDAENKIVKLLQDIEESYFETE